MAARVCDPSVFAELSNFSLPLAVTIPNAVPTVSVPCPDATVPKEKTGSNIYVFPKLAPLSALTAATPFTQQVNRPGLLQALFPLLRDRQTRLRSRDDKCSQSALRPS